MRQFAAFALFLALAGPAALGAEKETPEWKATKNLVKRQMIDAMARKALEEVLDRGENAADLFEKAVGYAVFDNLEIAFGISDGGGVGVAVDRSDSSRTYMRMGIAKSGRGLNRRQCQVVFLFCDEQAFARFVKKGWQADENVKPGLHDSMAIYQITKDGVPAQPDVVGTKYWRYKKLN